jgi:hypothetical protein
MPWLMLQLEQSPTPETWPRRRGWRVLYPLPFTASALAGCYGPSRYESRLCETVPPSMRKCVLSARSQRGTIISNRSKFAGHDPLRALRGSESTLAEAGNAVKTTGYAGDTRLLLRSRLHEALVFKAIQDHADDAAASRGAVVSPMRKRVWPLRARSMLAHASGDRPRWARAQCRGNKD